MKPRGWIAWSWVALAPGLSAAQSPEGLSHPADLSGVWTNDPPAETRAFQNYAFSLDPPELTAWGQARFDAARPGRGRRSYAIAESDDPVYDCFPPGAPRIYLHPLPMEIVQTPGRVLILFEYDHFFRQIFTDGRGHRTDLAPSWMGDSIGHWEGETLVIETTNFNDKTWLDRRGLPHSEELRLIERFSLVGDDRLRIDITVEDPVAYVEPWTAQRFLRRTDWQIEEFVCMDNVNFEAYENAVQEFDDASDDPP
jgi:hypothetical protein